MNITPINKNYITLNNTAMLNFGSKAGVKKDSANNIFCTKTIVPNTLKEFSNSRGQYLADIDLADIYIPNKKKNTAQFPPIIFGSAVKCLADQPLADTFELQKNSKKAQISFTGPFPQYLIDQDGVVEDYECTSNGIQDIANSSYCKTELFEFKGSAENNLLKRLCQKLKKCFTF